MLSVVMLNVLMLIVIMLNVLAPKQVAFAKAAANLIKTFKTRKIVTRLHSVKCNDYICAKF